MFEVSQAKREILEKLSERDWSPTDLADEIGKTPETVYNHLHDLEEQGILTKRQVPAKTRPKTEYSIGRGLIQYVTVLPDQYREGSLRIDETKEAMFRIWSIPQDEFHPFLERYWWTIHLQADVDLHDDVTAIGVYGSVARGEADADSDIDILLVTPDEEASSTIENTLGSTLLDFSGKTKIGMTEVYTVLEYRNSVTHGSDFLDSIQGELHPLYDPDRVLIDPEVLQNE